MTTTDTSQLVSVPLMAYIDSDARPLPFCPSCFGAQHHHFWCEAETPDSWPDDYIRWPCYLFDDIPGLPGVKCQAMFGDAPSLALHIVQFHPSFEGEALTLQRAIISATRSHGRPPRPSDPLVLRPVGPNTREPSRQLDRTKVVRVSARPARTLATASVVVTAPPPPSRRTVRRG
jgi:hypothetical protein